jgi:hypothetical protein
MNHRDVWIVGLLALAYLYLDSASPRGRGKIQLAGFAPREDDPVPWLPALAADGCPRNLSHSVSLRSDGAMWCLGCDEGFFPAEMVI